MTIVPEIDVLIATSIWLWERKVYPLNFSIATGRGIDMQKDQERLKNELKAAGVPGYPYQFSMEGPDIMAISKSEWWRIECKGAGAGKRSTHITSFDRGLASAVSHYSEEPPQFEGDLAVLNEARPFLGLALPITPVYLNELRRKVGSSLRKRLNLWLLLYNREGNTIKAVPPESEYD